MPDEQGEADGRREQDGRQGQYAAELAKQNLLQECASRRRDAEKTLLHA